MVDIYYMGKINGYSVLKYKEAIKKKTKFMLDLYKRYKENIEFLEYPSTNILNSEELKLMLVSPPKNLNQNITNLHDQLNEIRNELLKEFKERIPPVY